MNKIFVPYTIIAILLFGCGESTPSVDEKKENGNELSITLNNDQIKQLNIISQKIEIDTVASVLSIGGKIITPSQGFVEIGYPISVRINELLIEPGSNVTKGQKLLSVADLAMVELQQNYLMQKAEMETLQSHFNRLTAIKNENATSEKNFQDAQLALNRAKIALSGMEQKMNLLMIPFPKSANDIKQNISIVSPISGKIDQLNIKPGQYCPSGESFLKIINPSNLECELISFQNSPLELHEGMQVSLKDNSGSATTATIKRYSNSLQDSDHGQHIWLSLRNAPHNWISGMTVQGELAFNQLNCLPVPNSGIAYWESKPFVFVDQGNGTFNMVPATVVKEENNIAYVQFPEMGQKAVVTQSAHYLLMSIKNKGE